MHRGRPELRPPTLAVAVHRLDASDGSSGHELVCAEAVLIETDADGRIVETTTCVVVPGTDIHVHVEVLP